MRIRKHSNVKKRYVKAVYENKKAFKCENCDKGITQKKSMQV